MLLAYFFFFYYIFVDLILCEKCETQKWEIIPYNLHYKRTASLRGRETVQGEETRLSTSWVRMCVEVEAGNTKTKKLGVKYAGAVTTRRKQAVQIGNGEKQEAVGCLFG